MSYDADIRVALDDTLRDDIARALIAESHREVAEQLEADMGRPLDQDYCGGQTFDPPCGGCGVCMFQQQTYGDWNEPQFGLWRERADRIVRTLQGLAEFRANATSGAGGAS